MVRTGRSARLSSISPKTGATSSCPRRGPLAASLRQDVALHLRARRLLARPGDLFAPGCIQWCRAGFGEPTPRQHRPWRASGWAVDQPAWAWPVADGLRGDAEPARHPAERAASACRSDVCSRSSAGHDGRVLGVTDSLSWKRIGCPSDRDDSDSASLLQARRPALRSRDGFFPFTTGRQRHAAGPTRPAGPGWRPARVVEAHRAWPARTRRTRHVARPACGARCTWPR